jgi:hypothetical protein
MNVHDAPHRRLGVPCCGAARQPKILYVYFTPSQGSANRSASGRVLGAMARPASAYLGFLYPLSTSHWICGSFSPIIRCLTPLIPLLTTHCSGLQSLQSITKHYKAFAKHYKKHVMHYEYTSLAVKRESFLRNERLS